MTRRSMSGDTEEKDLGIPFAACSATVDANGISSTPWTSISRCMLVPQFVCGEAGVLADMRILTMRTAPQRMACAALC